MLGERIVPETHIPSWSREKNQAQPGEGRFSLPWTRNIFAYQNNFSVELSRFTLLKVPPSYSMKKLHLCPRVKCLPPPGRPFLVQAKSLRHSSINNPETSSEWRWEVRTFTFQQQKFWLLSFISEFSCFIFIRTESEPNDSVRVCFSLYATILSFQAWGLTRFTPKIHWILDPWIMRDVADVAAAHGAHVLVFRF